MNLPLDSRLKPSEFQAQLRKPCMAYLKAGRHQHEVNATLQATVQRLDAQFQKSRASLGGLKGQGMAAAASIAKGAISELESQGKLPPELAKAHGKELAAAMAGAMAPMVGGDADKAASAQLALQKLAANAVQVAAEAHTGGDDAAVAVKGMTQEDAQRLVSEATKKMVRAGAPTDMQDLLKNAGGSMGIANAAAKMASGKLGAA